MNQNNKHLYGNFKAMKKCVLIDDDLLIHKLWSMEAEKKNVYLFKFFSVDEFIKDSSKIEKDIEIFLDSNLGEHVKGEVEAEKIYNLGFENIYLVTGKDVEDIELRTWIKEIRGKRPLFC